MTKVKCDVQLADIAVVESAYLPPILLAELSRVVGHDLRPP